MYPLPRYSRSLGYNYAQDFVQSLKLTLSVAVTPTAGARLPGYTPPAPETSRATHQHRWKVNGDARGVLPFNGRSYASASTYTSTPCPVYVYLGRRKGDGTSGEASEKDSIE